MNPSIKLRPREPSDLPRLMEIINNVYSKTGYPVDGPSAFDQFLSPPAEDILHSVVAVLVDPEKNNQETQIVGHAFVMPPSLECPNLASKVHVERGGSLADHAVLSRFFVDPDTQARGVGTEILKEATWWSRKEGKRLVLVVLEKDARAIRMYEREGWEKVGEYIFTNKWDDGYNAFAYLGPRGPI